MRKNKVFAAFTLSLIFILGTTGCMSNVREENGTEKIIYSDTSKSLTKKLPHGKELYESLTEDQIRYLKERAGYFWSVENEDINSESFQNFIKDMKYEDVNSNLLGTGMELYNPSSGVEIFGLTYENTNGKSYTDMKSVSEDEITLEQAIEIRKKEKDITLDDFMKYKFRIEKDKGDNAGKRYNLNIPLKGYEDSYVQIPFVEEEGEVRILCGPDIDINTRHCIDKDNGEFGMSMVYFPVFLDVFKTDPEYIFKSTGDKIFVCLEEFTVTNRSLYLNFFGNLKNGGTYDTSFKIYDVRGGEEKLIKEYKGKKERYGTAGVPSVQRVFVDLGFDGKELPAGDYLLKYGNGDETLRTKEFNFTIK